MFKTQIYRRTTQVFQTYGSDLTRRPRPNGDAVDSGMSDSRAEMQHLNDRFATYINNVLHLEQQNKALFAELEQLKVKGMSRIGDLYEEEMKELRRQVEQLTKEKKGVELERDRFLYDFNVLSEKHQAEILHRQDVENELKEFRQVVHDAEQARTDMETEVESLKSEIIFMKKLHSQEIHGLQAQIQKQHIQIDMDVLKPDLTAALRDVRLQYEILATQHIQESEELYRSKFVSMYEAVSRDNEALRKARQEVHDYRRQVQTLSCEVRALKGTIEEMQASVSTEVANYEQIITDLKSNIDSMNDEISHQVLKYQDLLNVNMSLDMEIKAYRKLLEGGESQITAKTNSTLTLDQFYEKRISQESDGETSPESDGESRQED